MRFPKSKQFFFICLAFLFGCALAEFLPLGLNQFVVVALSCILSLIAFQKARLEIALLMMFAFGIFWPNFLLPEIGGEHIAFYNGEKKEFTAIVIGEPWKKETGLELIVQPESFKGKVIVQAEFFPEYKYGDRLQLNCNLEMPGKIEEFDYGKYLSVQGVYSVCNFAKIKLLASDAGNPFFAAILRSKSFFIEKINATLAEPEAGLMNGILIGDKSGLSRVLQDKFSLTGVSHIVAVSGYNITIIAAVLVALFKLWGINRKKSFWLIVGLIVLFVILTGMSASVVRAGIMGIIVLIAKQAGRKGNVRNVLALTATVMVFCNPKILLWDAGFQLSFISTLGLVYLSPILEKYFRFVPEKFALRENLSTTMSAIVATLPLILYNFHRVSFVAPIVNILILPAIPLAMLLGAIQLGAGIIWIKIGEIVGWFSWVVLAYVIKTVEWFAGLPFASAEMAIGFLTMVVLYSVIIGFVIYCKMAVDNKN